MYMYMDQFTWVFELSLLINMYTCIHNLPIIHVYMYEASGIGNGVCE